MNKLNLVTGVVIVLLTAWISALYIDINALTASVGVETFRSISDETKLVACLSK